MGLAQETKEVVEQAKGIERTVYQVISQSVQRLKELKEEVEKAPDPLKLLDKVIKELEQITRDFERMARREEEIERDLLSKQRALHHLVDRASEELQRLKLKKADYDQKSQTTTDPEKKEGYGRVSRYVQTQIEVWEEFLRTHEGIEEQMKGIDQRVDRFLSTIEMSALVYREGLNALELLRDIREAQALLAEIPEIERLTQEMITSWQVLDSLINELFTFAAQTPAK
jgi:methyl-accepting chemotaxis protein